MTSPFYCLTRRSEPDGVEQTNEPGRQLGVRVRAANGEHGAERGDRHACPEQRAVLALEDVAVVRRVNRDLAAARRRPDTCLRARCPCCVSPTRLTVTPTTAVATPAAPSAIPDQNIAPRCSPEDAVGFSCANAGVRGQREHQQHRNTSHVGTSRQPARLRTDSFEPLGGEPAFAHRFDVLREAGAYVTQMNSRDRSNFYNLCSPESGRMRPC